MSDIPGIQSELIELLSATIQGNNLTRSSRILFPVIRNVKKSSKRQLANISGRVREIVVEPIQHREKRGFENCLMSVRSSFQNAVVHANSNLPKSKVRVLKNFNASDYRSHELSTVQELQRYIKLNLAPYLVDAYLHGSLSTLDFTGYSDMDVLLIVKREVFHELKTFKKIQLHITKALSFLFEFDPLQHHGFFILHEDDLQNYSQSYLPLGTFAKATSLLGISPELTFRLCDSQEECRKRFENSTNIIRRYLTLPERLRLAYYFKGFLSHFMILPALFLQVKGIFVSKRESFSQLGNEVEPSLWIAMEMASKIRQEWPSSRNLSRVWSTINKLNPLFYNLHSQRIRLEDIGLKVEFSVLLNKIERFLDYLITRLSNECKPAWGKPIIH